MTDILPEHDHCQMCDDPVELGQRFCSQKCEDDHMVEIKKEKLKSYLFLAAIGVVVVAVTFSLLTL